MTMGVILALYVTWSFRTYYTKKKGGGDNKLIFIYH